MHAPPSPLSFQTDLVPLPVAICLSTIAVVDAVIKLGGCFLQPQVRPWLLFISCISLGSSAGLLGVISATNHTNEIFYVAQLDILQFCCTLPGLFEAQFLWHLLSKTPYPWMQTACRVAAICSSLLTVGLCIWFPLQNAQASRIFIASLFVVLILYFCLSIVHFYLSTVLVSLPLLFRMIGSLCLLVFIFTCISLAVAWSKPEVLVAAIWAIFTSSNAIANRFLLCQLYSRRRHQRDPEVAIGDGESRPPGQNSPTEFLPVPAVMCRLQSERGFIDL